MNYQKPFQLAPNNIANTIRCNTQFKWMYCFVFYAVHSLLTIYFFFFVFLLMLFMQFIRPLTAAHTNIRDMWNAYTFFSLKSQLAISFVAFHGNWSLIGKVLQLFFFGTSVGGMHEWQVLGMNKRMLGWLSWILKIIDSQNWKGQIYFQMCNLFPFFFLSNSWLWMLTICFCYCALL